MVRKRYKLFGWTIWEIEAELDQVEEVEDDEVMEKDITSTLSTGSGETPMFGFTNWKEYTGDDDE